MKTIKEFLDSDNYFEFIKFFDSSVPIEHEIKVMEIARLNDRLKQRQFLLEGFNCKVYSEDQSVDWYIQLIAQDKENIIRWIEGFLRYSNDTPDQYPDGEFPEGEEPSEYEKSKVISVGKLGKSSFAMYMIEFEILNNHSEILVDYYKSLRIPGANKYAKEMKKLFNSIFVK